MFSNLISILRSKYGWLYLLTGALILIIILIEAEEDGDFGIFLSASIDLVHQKNIYVLKYKEWFHYYYDVLFALILVPFTYLPVYWVKVIWLLLNTFFVYRIWKIVKAWLPVEMLSNKARVFFTVFTFVFMLRFLRDNFHLAQVSIFILYTCLEGLYLIFTHRRIGGALLLAFGITVKLMPLVFIPYLIWRKEWRVSFYIIFFIGLLLILPSLFIGHEYNMFLLKERYLSLNPANKEHILDTNERSFHSLSTLLATLFVEDCGDANHVLPIKRNLADISLDKLSLIINLARLFFIGLTLFFLRSLPFKTSHSNVYRLYEIGYLCLIVPLIFPHQQHYAFVFMFPAVAYVMFYLANGFLTGNMLNPREKRKRNLLVAFLSLIFLLTSSHFILGQFREYYDHFKVLTYGVLMFIALYAVCNPFRNERTV